MMIQPIDQAEDPFVLFARWFEDAKRAEPNDPEAMALATVAADGTPSLRMVLMKEYNAGGFVFYTNYSSRKAAQLTAIPNAALGFHWKSLRRAVRIEGTIATVTAAESDAYFATRPYGSQIGAWASLQSQTLDRRSTLEARTAEFERLYSPGQVPRPAHWGGYRIIPNRIEFWQDMPYRLHDRVVFTRESFTAPWLAERLYP